MSREDKNVVAIFDGLAYLAESVHKLAELVYYDISHGQNTDNKALDCMTLADQAKDIFRKAASEANGTLNPQNSEKNKEKEEAKDNA